MTVVGELDQRLFSSYIKTKLEIAVTLLRNGILAPDMDWYDTPQPSGRGFRIHHISCQFYTHNASDGSPEIRPYMFETLMCLVDVHGQVCSTAESLLDRTLHALVEGLAVEALKCIRQVERFGVGGMLCVGPSLSYIPDGNNFDCAVSLRRRRWRSSLCIRHWGDMLLLPPQRRCLISTTGSLRPMLDVQVTKAYKQTWMASRKRWRTVVARLRSSSFASSRRKRHQAKHQRREK
jgi:hypothetical protein